MSTEKITGWRNRPAPMPPRSDSGSDHRIIGLKSSRSSLAPRRMVGLVITPPASDAEKDARFALRRGTLPAHERGAA